MVVNSPLRQPATGCNARVKGCHVLIGACVCGGDVVITGTSYVRLHIPGEQVKRRPCTRRLPFSAKAWRREVNVSGGHEMLECHMTLLIYARGLV